MRRLLNIPERLGILFCRNRDGYILPFVLIMMTLMLSAGVIFLSAVALSLENGSDYRDYQLAVLAGKNAVEICRARLSSDSNYAGTTEKEILEDGSTYMIKIQKISETARFITIKTVSGEYGRKYEGEAELDPATGQVIKWSLCLKRWDGEK